MSSTLRRFALVIVISFFGGKSLCASKNSQINFRKIERKIEIGQLDKAEKELKKIEKKRILNYEEKYYCSKLLTTIYLTKQSFNHYSLEIDKLIRFSKKLNPIFRSEAYAHKAYYWHYMMWADSALVYSNKSMALYRKYEKFRVKIDVPFIYEVHAITYLYRNDQLKPKAYLDVPIKDFKRKQFQWFDSSIIYENNFPFQFSTQRSMLYRSYANRWLDEVVGQRPKVPSTLQLFAFNKANALYDKGISCLKSYHKNDYLILLGLKAAIHTYIHRYEEADLIFSKGLKSISQEDLMNRSKLDYHPLMTFLTFRVRNTSKLPFDRNKINNEISLLLKLKYEFWKSFDKNNDFPYDPYRTSPYINLFNLYTLKSQNEPQNKANYAKAVSYLLTLKVYFYFLKNIKITPSKMPYFDVRTIQKKLKKNECFLFMQSDNDLLDGKKILITSNKIQFIKSYRICELNNINLDTLSFDQFKRMSYNAYQNNFQQLLKLFPNAKKIYISHDDLIPYEILLKDTLCQSFSEAQFIGHKLNFVRLYNPYSYFNTSVESHNTRLDVRALKQKSMSKLFFMDEYFDNFSTSQPFSKKNYSGNLKQLLFKTGILHLYGHGEFKFDESANTNGFQMRYSINNKNKSERKLTGDFVCNRDLVVLNNCFSGYPFYNINEFNKTIPLRILSNGAKSLICSPTKVDDYYSAEFFKLFYQKIATGILYDDAFFEAKQQFVQKHPDMRNPKIWNGLQLIVSFKIQNKTENQTNYVYLSILIISIFDTILTALHVLLHTKKRPHPPKEQLL